MSKKNAFATAALAALATTGGLAVGVNAANAQTAAPPPPPPSVTTRWVGGTETREEDRRFHISGRLQYDVYDINTDFPGTSNDSDYTRSAVRRAFLGVDGRFTDHWRYNFKVAFNPAADAASATTSDFCRDNVTGGLFPLASGASCASGFTKQTIASAASGGADDVTLDDAYLEYAGDNFSIILGQNNSISPMEDRDSSLNIPFNERSAFINAFGFGKIVGVDFITNGGNWSWGIGFHGDDAGNPEPGGVSRAGEANYEITRGTWAPIYSRTPDGVTVLHLGLTARHRDNGGDGTFRYRARPEVGFGTRYIDTNGSAAPSAAATSANAAAKSGAIPRLPRQRTLIGKLFCPADALRAVSFSMARGETIGLIGESGCGKSITALALMGLLPEGAEVAGSIRFDGTELTTLDEAAWCRLRGNRIGMVFQEPMSALNPLHTVGHQIAESLRLHKGLDARTARAEALRLLERVQLPQARARLDAHPHQLSGGQRQRVVIAIALACGPDLLVADEPTTALDVTIQREVLDLIDELVRDSGMGLVLISHNLGVMADRVQRLFVMYGGTMSESGPTAEVFARRAHPYTIGLFAAPRAVFAPHPPGPSPRLSPGRARRRIVAGRPRPRATPSHSEGAFR